MRQASLCSWQCQKNNFIYALKYKSQSYTTDVAIMVASMWGWIQWWYGTLEPWNSHGMLYLHDWWSVGSVTSLCGLTDWEWESLRYKYAGSIIKLYRSIVGACEHYLQHNPKITRDITYLGPSSGLTNVLDLGDIRGLQPSTMWNTWETTIPRGTKDSSQVVQGTHQWC